jgi:mannose-6-phosphate isomerase
MAASDNVVRSGLTPKFKVDLYLTKDVNTLVEMLTYNYGTADSQILKGSPYKSLKHSKEYNPPIEEFSILQTHLVKGNETIPGMEGPGIMIATSGSGSIKIGSKVMSCKSGFVYFVPAFTEVTLINDQMEPFIVYRAFCDECNEIIL